MLNKLKGFAEILTKDGMPLEIAHDTPLNAAQQWVLAVGSLLNAKEGFALNTLTTGSHPETLLYAFQNFWGVNNRDDFLQLVQRLSGFPNQQDYELIWTEMRKAVSGESSSKGKLSGMFFSFVKSLAETDFGAAHTGVKNLQGKVDYDTEQLTLMMNNCFKWVELLETLNIRPDQVTNLMIWDASRLINTSRWALEQQWITPEQYFHICTPVAAKVQAAYSDWKSLTDACLVSSMIFAYEEERWDDFKASHERLIKDPQSPLTRLPWKLSLNEAL
jgi:hypothetical protein